MDKQLCSSEESVLKSFSCSIAATDMFAARLSVPGKTFAFASQCITASQIDTFFRSFEPSAPKIMASC